MVTTRPVICVVGPTASGKTSFSQALAVHLNAEVISADSMQIYKGMDIGTGKPSKADLLVKHYGFDLLNPGEPYSAALFQTYARSCFQEISAKGKTPMLVGGTGFYLRAAIDDYRFPKGDQVGNAVRDHYQRIAEAKGSYYVWELLKDTDPKSADLIPPADTKRVIRAFELLSDGCSYAEQKEKLSALPQLIPAYQVGLSVNPVILAQRIDKRVDAMFEAGLIEEVKNLLDKGLRDGLTAPQAIGYKEIVEALEGRISMDEAREQIKTSTRRYAKRQRTWFRKDKRINWIDADELDLDSMLSASLRILKEQGFIFDLN